MSRDGGRRTGGDRERGVGRASRRGALALGVSGLLAGCLVTSEGADGGPTEQTEGGADNGTAAGDDGSDDGGSGGGDSGGSGSGDEVPDEVGPDGSGLVVTDAAVRDVTEGGGRTTVRARLTVENAGRFEYGVVEFRVDAYATPAGSDERDAVGFGYVTRRFPADDRFDGSRARRFEAEITFPSDRTRVRPDPDRYAVDAAVRRADPV